MNWTIFDDWKMDKTYSLNDIVVKDDILYQSIKNASPIALCKN